MLCYIKIIQLNSNDPRAVQKLKKGIYSEQFCNNNYTAIIPLLTGENIDGFDAYS